MTNEETQELEFIHHTQEEQEEQEAYDNDILNKATEFNKHTP
jgi:hypothetical protein